MKRIELGVRRFGAVLEEADVIGLAFEGDTENGQLLVEMRLRPDIVDELIERLRAARSAAG